MRQATRVKVEAYYSGRAGYPLGGVLPGEVRVFTSESPHRRAMRSVLVLYVLSDRALVSTQHELVKPVEGLVSVVATAGELADESIHQQLFRLCAERLGRDARLVPYSGVKLYCDEEEYVRIVDEHVRRVTRGDVDIVMAALRVVGAPDDPDYFLKDDAAFAYWVDDTPVSFAGTHPVGEFSDRIGNVMVGTLDGHRRRGYGKAVVSATTGELLRQGRVAVWGTETTNVASIRTARSVGYQPFATVFEVRFA
jgi:GNAT superfamily N-acetyltransferase